MTTDAHLPKAANSVVPTAWRAIADLPLTITEIDTRSHSLPVGPMFNRMTTELLLIGNGHEGRGEDVSYGFETQEQLPAHFKALPLVGTHTVGSLSALLDTLELSPRVEGWELYTDYNRWTLESAALDLALKQAGLTFAQAVGVSTEPMNWVLSMSLGSPVDTQKVHDWITHVPGVEFKLDASDLWTAEICRELAATDAIAVVDLKGHYGAAADTWMTNQPTPQTYTDVARSFDDAFLEDAKIDEPFRSALGPDGLSRLTWDAPIHSIADIAHFCSLTPTFAINIKPSRFGTLRELFGAIEYCIEHQLPMYAGGQTELSIGRTQAQTLAACWYADAGNDLAPVAYHAAKPGDTVPLGPIVVPDQPGFGFDA